MYMNEIDGFSLARFLVRGIATVIKRKPLMRGEHSRFKEKSCLRRRVSKRLVGGFIVQWLNYRETSFERSATEQTNSRKTKKVLA